jgi:hypothetical protein
MSWIQELNQELNIGAERLSRIHEFMEMLETGDGYGSWREKLKQELDIRA